jgi:adenylate cyclase
VENSSQGLEVVYALLWDDKGNLDTAASTVNWRLLQRISDPLTKLYLEDRARCLEVLALGHRQPGIRRLRNKLTTPDRNVVIGKLDLGISTQTIDQELRRSLQRDAAVLLATLLLGVAGSLWMARRIAQPLTDLSSAMGRVQQGDFDVRVTQSRARQDEVGDLARAFDAMTDGLKDRERLRNTLGRYVSAPVAERILSEESDLLLRGEVRQVTVLFLDVRGFTSVSEQLSPAEVVALLNEYFDVVVDRVTANGGTVNKFIGDSAMCIWGAPAANPQAERGAVACALQIQEAVARLSADRVRRGLTSVGLGIGINAGEAVAGNLGAARRLEYTVIGDAVNVAQRLESQAQAGEVLVSQAVYERVAEWVDASPREPVKLKGKSQPVPLWLIRGAKAAATEAA